MVTQSSLLQRQDANNVQRPVLEILCTCVTQDIKCCTHLQLDDTIVTHESCCSVLLVCKQDEGNICQNFEIKFDDFKGHMMSTERA